MDRARLAGLALAGIAVAACGRAPQVSDTGYTGTWERGGERVRATLAIARVDGRWLWNARVLSRDKLVDLRCDWDGRCTERNAGRTAADYRCELSEPSAGPPLLLECRGRWLWPEEKGLHQLRELELSEDHRMLWVRSIRDGDLVYPAEARPARSFVKIDDAVPEIPRELASGS